MCALRYRWHASTIFDLLVIDLVFFAAEPARAEARPVMDIYDGADWTGMDIDDLKAAIEYGRSIEEAASFFAVPIASMTARANVKSLA
jgi:hypothetical protein